MQLVTTALPRRLLPPPAHRQGAARRARRGADRSVGLPLGRGRGAGCWPATRRGREQAAEEYREILGHDGFLPRGAGPRPARRAGGAARAIERALAGDRNPGRRHQRLPLPPSRGRRGAPGPDRHRPEQDARRDGPRLRVQRRVLRQVAGRDGAAVRRSPGALARTGRDRRALPRDLPGRRSSTCRATRFPRASCPTTTSRSWRARGWSERLADGRTRRIPAAEYWPRLETELAIIHSMGFEGYFLVVWDFIRFAREHGIPVGPGRGSAAGSLVAYALRITDIDPLEYDLLFERFLNPDRVSMPDIDIDFCQRRRDEVIAHVRARLRRGERLARSPPSTSCRPARCIRDVGRVMGMSFAETDRIAKLVPDGARRHARGGAAATRRAWPRRCSRSADVARLVEIGKRLEGLARHCGVHAAGVVIAPRPVREIVPLYRTSRDEVVTQFDKDVIEKLGLLKMDFLGLKTLTVIDDCLHSLEAAGDRAARLRPDDVRRPRGLRPLLRRGHGRHLPVRVVRDARPAAHGAAAPVRGAGGPQRPLPARADAVDRRVRRPQARPPADHLHLPGARGDPGRDLRRHRLPGAGDAHRGADRRLLDGARRHAAQGDGQEDQGADRRAGRALRRRAASPRATRGTRSRRCGGRSCRSPSTASTSRTRSRTPTSPTRPPT